MWPRRRRRVSAEPAVERPLSRRVARSDLRDPRPGATHDVVGIGHRAGVGVELRFVLERDDAVDDLEVEIEIDPADQIGGSAVRTVRRRAARTSTSRRSPAPHRTAPTTRRARRPTVRDGRRLPTSLARVQSGRAGGHVPGDGVARGGDEPRRRPTDDTARPTSASESSARRSQIAPGDHSFCWACNSAEKNANAVFVFVC